MNDFYFDYEAFDGVGSAEEGLSVVFGESVQKIPSSLFEQNPSLQSVVIGNHVTNIGRYAFSYCKGLTSVTIGTSVTSVGGRAFYNCSALTTMNYNAVNMNDLNWLDYTFDGVGSSEQGLSVIFGDSVQTIPAELFYNNTALTSVSIGKNVETIGYEAFDGCSSLTSVTIPDSVTNIGGGAFAYCSSLTSITLGESVTSIGDAAFQQCVGLTEMNYNAVNMADFGPKSTAFSGIGSSQNNLTVTFGDSVQTIPAYLFYNNTALTSISIGENVETIGDYAFDGCTNLNTVTFAGSKTQWDAITIGEYNTSLTSEVVFLGSSIPSEKGTTISIGTGPYTVIVGETNVFVNTFTVSCSDAAASGTVRWQSSNPAVFEVTGDTSATYRDGVALYGIYGRGNSLGSAVITISTDDGATASFTVKVQNSMSSVSITGNTTLAVGDDLLIRADVCFGTNCWDATGTWTSSNPGIVLFYASDKSQQNFSYTGADTGIRNQTVWLTVYGEQAGETTLTCTLADGTSAEYKITVYPKEVSELWSSAIDWQTAYYNFISTVQSVVDQNRDKLADDTVALQAEALQLADANSTTNERLVTFKVSDLTSQEQADVYYAVSEFLAELTELKFDFNFSVSGADKDTYETTIATKIIKSVINAMDTSTHTYSYNGHTIEIGGISVSGAHMRSITYDGELVAVLCSTRSQVESVIRSYVSELIKLGKNEVNEAYAQMVKSVFGKNLDGLVQVQVSNALTPYASKLENIGVGKVLTVVNESINYYNFVKKLWNSDTGDLISTLGELQNLSYSDPSITDKTVKIAMKSLTNAQKRVKNAILKYLNNEQVDVGSEVVGWLKNTGSSIVSSFKCPVEISVYDENGQLVGHVSDDDLWYDEDVIYIERKGDLKTIYTNNTGLSYAVTGTDYGTLNCTFEEYLDGNVVGRVNYYDIELYQGKEISVEVPTENLTKETMKVVTEEELLTADEEILAADYTSDQVYITCAADSPEGGNIYGAGGYVRGDTVILVAEAVRGYVFLGWINRDGAVMSTSNVYVFTAKESCALTATFLAVPSSLENDLVKITEKYVDVYDVTVEQVGTSFTVSLINLKETESEMPFVLLAQYNEDGQMISAEIINGTQTDSGVEFYGIMPDNPCKLFMLDKDYCPVIEAYMNT